MTQNSALVLFSGGQDSTTCLAWALNRYQRVETIGFDYGQRHRVELDCRTVIREKITAIKPAWAKHLGDDHLLDLSILGQISDTALTSDAEIRMEASGLPNTFVPGRNILFLTFAGTLAYRRNISTIIGGMCETDFSGYPDCRDEAIKATGLAINLGMDSHFTIETPLMWLDKADSWDLAEKEGGQTLVDLIVNETHTCYLGTRGTPHPWGHGCGTCPACELREKGWRQYQGLPLDDGDVLVER